MNGRTRKDSSASRVRRLTGVINHFAKGVAAVKLAQGRSQCDGKQVRP
jgi:hypothetical protein